MFKRDKHTVVSTRSLLKNRDVRRLRQDVCEQWKCHVDELNKIKHPAFETYRAVSLQRSLRSVDERLQLLAIPTAVDAAFDGLAKLRIFVACFDAVAARLRADFASLFAAAGLRAAELGANCREQEEQRARELGARHGATRHQILRALGKATTTKLGFAG